MGATLCPTSDAALLSRQAAAVWDAAPAAVSAHRECATSVAALPAISCAGPGPDVWSATVAALLLATRFRRHGHGAQFVASVTPCAPRGADWEALLFAFILGSQL